jgi:hypothetical protein
MRRNIKNKKTKKKVLHGGSTAKERLRAAQREESRMQKEREREREREEKREIEVREKVVREKWERCQAAKPHTWEQWYNKYIIEQCDCDDDDETSFHKTFHESARGKSYNKYNSPLEKNSDGNEVMPKNASEAHEWHKLIANNNEIRDFAILKLLFQLTEQQRNSHRIMIEYFKMVISKMDMSTSPTTPTTNQNPNKIPTE